MTKDLSKNIMMVSQHISEYTCELCGQDALSENDMRTHLLLEHIEGSISCPFCNLSNVTLEEMNEHIESQHHEQLRSPQHSPNAMHNEWTADKQFNHHVPHFLGVKENLDPNAKVRNLLV